MMVMMMMMGGEDGEATNKARLDWRKAGDDICVSVLLSSCAITR